MVISEDRSGAVRTR